MSPRQLAALGLALAVLLGALAGVSYVRGRKSAPQLLWSGSPEKIDRLSLEKPGQKEVFEKKDGSWRMKEPFELPADGSNLEDLTQRLAHLELSPYLTETPSKFGLFQVDDAAGLRLRAQAGSSAPAIDVVLGKQGGAFDSIYLKRGGADAVYEASGLPRYMVDKAPKDWLDKSVVSVKSDELASIKVRNSSGTLVFERRGSGWAMTEPPSSLSTGTVKARLESALVALVRLEADEVLLSSETPKKAGFDQPSLQVTLVPKSGKETVIEAGAKSSGGKIYVRKTGEDRLVYLLSPFRLDPFRKGPSEFR